MTRRTAATTTVGIIGTSCRRGHDMDQMTETLFSKMLERCRQILADRVLPLCGRLPLLISGGSACSDHLAVVLWLERPESFAGLRLYLPCAWSRSDGRFVDGRGPGRTLNSLHRLFSARFGRYSLGDLSRALALCAEFVTTASGFHARNEQVARHSRHLVAFSWSGHGRVKDSVPVDEGTLDTWSRCTGFKVHVPLALIDCRIARAMVPSALRFGAPYGRVESETSSGRHG